jgi:hypothetical protein
MVSVFKFSEGAVIKFLTTEQLRQNYSAVSRIIIFFFFKDNIIKKFILEKNQGVKKFSGAATPAPEYLKFIWLPFVLL